MPRHAERGSHRRQAEDASGEAADRIRIELLETNPT